MREKKRKKREQNQEIIMTSEESTTQLTEQRTHFKVGSRKSKLAMVQTE